MNRTVVIAVLAMMLGCKKYNSNDGAFRDDFTFTMEDTTGVRADGVSYITLRFTNKLELRDNFKVVFSTNKGTILQPEQFYLNNLAETRLLLAEDTGRYFIKATLKEGEMVKLEKSVTASFQQAYIPQQYTMEIYDSSNLRANGISTFGVRLQSTFIPQRQNLVAHFETSKGALQQTDVPFINGLAFTRITVPQDTGAYVVKAQIKDGAAVKIEKTAIFAFRRANPETINLELNSSTWNANQTIVIKTFLSRSEGKVTIGQPVAFQAYQIFAGVNVNVGRFEGLLNNVSNAAGQFADVKLILDTPNLDATKPVLLKAETFSDAAIPISITLNIAHI